ncbi:putative Holliday junction resolvase [Balneicella halophila]|uniref:Putative pre-16S rRNA nuclease n=1 Tax=Balneicella halophila TaxID=1537566 RepID=A0A7L4UNH2_BALHA|nr:Holliday junction resolvase RuvX [Balneicella halophila]PVX50733.1 putative Holliday junction resolvase [Balneicella halophila]
MGRILAIDYGRKRSGIAVTDNLKLIANGLCTVKSAELIAFLEDYLKKEKVDTVVIGYPKTLQNTASESLRYINPFIKQLTKKFPDLHIVQYDERFTSKMAFQTMIDSGIGKMKRQNKALVDKISATIILQSYMENLRNKIL